MQASIRCDLFIRLVCFADGCSDDVKAAVSGLPIRLLI